MTGRRFPSGVRLRLSLWSLVIALSCCRSGGPSDEWDAFPGDPALPRRATRQAREVSWAGRLPLAEGEPTSAAPVVSARTHGYVRVAAAAAGPWRLARSLKSLPPSLTIHTGLAASCRLDAPGLSLVLAPLTLATIDLDAPPRGDGEAREWTVRWQLVYGRIDALDPGREFSLAAGAGAPMRWRGRCRAATHENRPGFGVWMRFEGREAECRHDPGAADHEIRAYRGWGECRVPEIDGRPRRYGLHFIVTEPELSRLDAEGPTHFGRLFEDPLLWHRQHRFDDFFGQDRRRRFRVDVTDLEATPARR